MNDIVAKINDLIDSLTGDEIVEIGVGLVAKGCFRTKAMDGTKQARQNAQAACSVIRGIELDFSRQLDR